MEKILTSLATLLVKIIELIRLVLKRTKNCTECPNSDLVGDTQYKEEGVC